jgi:putative ABC transport system ATP-binding protein
LLLEECRERGSSLLFVSHDMALAGSFDRTVDLRAINGVAPSAVQTIGAA